MIIYDYSWIFMNIYEYSKETDMYSAYCSS